MDKNGQMGIFYKGKTRKSELELVKYRIHQNSVFAKITMKKKVRNSVFLNKILLRKNERKLTKN